MEYKKRTKSDKTQKNSVLYTMRSGIIKGDKSRDSVCSPLASRRVESKSPMVVVLVRDAKAGTSMCSTPPPQIILVVQIAGLACPSAHSTVHLLLCTLSLSPVRSASMLSEAAISSSPTSSTGFFFLFLFLLGLYDCGEKKEIN